MRQALKPLIKQYKEDIKDKTSDEIKVISWDYASELDADMAEARLMEGNRRWRKNLNNTDNEQKELKDG